MYHAEAAFDEVLVVALVRGAPLQFREGGHAGQGVVFHVLETVDVLAPDVGLDAEDMFLLFRGQLVGQRVERIDAFHG